MSFQLKYCKVGGSFQSIPKLSCNPMARIEAVSLPLPAKISMAKSWLSGGFFKRDGSRFGWAGSCKIEASADGCHWCFWRLWGFSQPGSAQRCMPRLQRSPGLAFGQPWSKLNAQQRRSPDDVCKFLLISPLGTLGPRPRLPLSFLCLCPWMVQGRRVFWAIWNV